MVSILEQQHGYIKYPCYLCLWDSRAKSQHWGKTVWPLRIALNVGEREKKTLLLNLSYHVKEFSFHLCISNLHLRKQFVKTLNKKSDCSKYICKAFSGLSDEKLQGGIPDGP